MKKEYVLITPVHNEEQFIGQVMESVIAQTVLPKKWLIVDDGSTDRSSEIIREYAAHYDFILCHQLKRSGVKTYYARRIEAILAGIEQIKHLAYDFLAVFRTSPNFIFGFFFIVAFTCLFQAVGFLFFFAILFFLFSFIHKFDPLHLDRLVMNRMILLNHINFLFFHNKLFLHLQVIL